jgi:hypothetical protein
MASEKDDKKKPAKPAAAKPAADNPAAKASAEASEKPAPKAAKADKPAKAPKAAAEYAGPPCRVDGCKQPVRAKGYCRKHFIGWRRGALGDHHRYKICSKEACRKPRTKGGLCDEHAGVAAPAAAESAAPAAGTGSAPA